MNDSGVGDGIAVNRDDWRAELGATLAAMTFDQSRRIFCVMDGAFFDDLPMEFLMRDMAHRSLYLEATDRQLMLAGPWLADPFPGGVTGDHAGPIDAILDIAGDKPAAVFWIGDAGLDEAVLYRNLRTLNKVLIPKSRAGESRSGDASTVLPGARQDVMQSGMNEAVHFRHADGNVLAEVLPVLHAEQFSRFFGPARAVMFHAPDHPSLAGSTIRSAVLPTDAPPAPIGMLKLDEGQIDGIEAARLDRTKLRITRYLRKVAPDKTRRLGDDELAEKTKAFMHEAATFGVRTEAGLGRWC